MTGYNPLLSVIKNRPLSLLVVLYQAAYPDRALPRTRLGELQRDRLLDGLLAYAKSSPVAAARLAMRAKGA